MSRTLLVANHSLLFLCTSMYLGTGWSLVLFEFPTVDTLNVGNYYDRFVPQVTAATHFFTWMTMVLIVSSIVMIVAERHTLLIVVPVVVLAGVVAATVLTVVWILPLNKRMSDGIHDPGELLDIARRWMRLNVARVLLWTVQWSAMMVYFARQALRATPAQEPRALPAGDPA